MGSILESAAAKVLSVYSCPKEGCMRQCSEKAERSTLHDQARQGYLRDVGEGRRYADIASSPWFYSDKNDSSERRLGPQGGKEAIPVKHGPKGFLDVQI